MIKVSFIVIAYNEARTIARCLDSILSQTNLENYELIVVDDGSLDDTSKIVLQYAKNNSNIKLFKFNENKGRGEARSYGVENAQGDYLALVDSDILLPRDWLKICLEHIKENDAVGGVAVPDGDVSYLYLRFGLKPKVVPHTTVVTGSNGLYKKEIFNSINFNSAYRDGEDVVFNHLMEEKSFKSYTIQSLLVEHKEAKDFYEACCWLYQSGRGATRQLKQFKKIRLPDLVYFGFLFTLVLSILAGMLTGVFQLFFVVLFYIGLASFLHIKSKFVYEPKKPLSYFSAVLVNSILLSFYFAGRTVGAFDTVLQPKRNKKNIIICFDFESKWGMPFKYEYGLAKTTRNLLDILKKHEVEAVFFITGKIIENEPDLVRQIFDQGHEIGVHGYSHEHLDRLNEQGLEEFDVNLKMIGDRLESLIGKRPIAFRSPYFMAPKFYTPEVYDILEKHGYKWVSNRELRYTEELFHNKIRIPWLWGKNNFATRVFSLLLNLDVAIKEKRVFKDKGILKIIKNIVWIYRGAKPFKCGKLLEVPVYSPLDSDLLGLPDPNTDSADDIVEYSINALSAGISRPGDLYMLSFHDWVIGGGNRKKVLDQVLTNLRKGNQSDFKTSPINFYE